MIRSLLAPAVPIVAVIAAAWIVAPHLTGVQPGAPMLIAGAEPADALQAAAFEGCATATLLADRLGALDATPAPGTIRIVAVQTGSASPSVSVGEIPAQAGAGATIVLVIDAAGRLVSGVNASALPLAQGALPPGCAEPPNTYAGPGAV